MESSHPCHVMPPAPCPAPCRSCSDAIADPDLQQVAAKGPRTFPGPFPEGPVEGAGFGETQLGGNLRHAQLILAQQRLRQATAYFILERGIALSFITQSPSQRCRRHLEPFGNYVEVRPVGGGGLLQAVAQPGHPSGVVTIAHQQVGRDIAQEGLQGDVGANYRKVQVDGIEAQAAARLVEVDGTPKNSR